MTSTISSLTRPPTTTTAHVEPSCDRRTGKTGRTRPKWTTGGDRAPGHPTITCRHTESATDLQEATLARRAALAEIRGDYLPDPTACLREIARILRPTGRAVLGVGDPDFMATLPFTKERVQLRPLPEVLEIVRAAGFDVATTYELGPAARHFTSSSLPLRRTNR
jgi:hypothetical protein